MQETQPLSERLQNLPTVTYEKIQLLIRAALESPRSVRSQLIGAMLIALNAYTPVENATAKDANQPDKVGQPTQVTKGITPTPEAPTRVPQATKPAMMPTATSILKPTATSEATVQTEIDRKVTFDKALNIRKGHGTNFEKTGTVVTPGQEYDDFQRFTVSAQEVWVRISPDGTKPEQWVALIYGGTTNGTEYAKTAQEGGTGGEISDADLLQKAQAAGLNAVAVDSTGQYPIALDTNHKVLATFVGDAWQPALEQTATVTETSSITETEQKEVPQAVKDFLQDSVKELGSTLAVENIKLVDGLSHTYTAEIVANGKVIIRATALNTPSGVYGFGLPANLMDELLQDGYISQAEYNQYAQAKLFIVPGQELAPEQSAFGATYESTGLNPDQKAVEQQAIQNMAEKLRILGAIQLAIKNNQKTTGAGVLALMQTIKTFNSFELLNPGIAEDPNIELAPVGWTAGTNVSGAVKVDNQKSLQVANISQGTDEIFKVGNRGPQRLDKAPSLSLLSTLEMVIIKVEGKSVLYQTSTSGVNLLLPNSEGVYELSNPFYFYQAGQTDLTNVTGQFGEDHFYRRLLKLSGQKEQLTPRATALQQKIIEAYKKQDYPTVIKLATGFQAPSFLFKVSALQ